MQKATMLLPLLILTSFSLVACDQHSKDLLCEDQYQNGQRFHVDNFIKECVSSSSFWRVSIVGCLTPEKKEIKLGEDVEEGTCRYKCVRTLEGAKVEVESKTASRITRPPMKCMDIYENGAKFTERNFVKQCLSTSYSWKAIIVGCLSPLKKEIAIGGEEKENGMIYSCIGNEKGATIETRTEEAKTTITECEGGYKNGQKFEDGNFMKKCIVSEGRIVMTIVGCLTPLKTEFAVGTKMTENGCTLSCIKSDNGVKMESEGGEEKAKNLLCDDKYHNGEKIPSGNFMKVCKSTPYSWVITIESCLTPDKKEIAIGSSAVENDLRFKCIKTDKGARVETEFANE